MSFKFFKADWFNKITTKIEQSLRFQRHQILGASQAKNFIYFYRRACFNIACVGPSAVSRMLGATAASPLRSFRANKYFVNIGRNQFEVVLSVLNSLVGGKHQQGRGDLNSIGLYGTSILKGFHVYRSIRFSVYSTPAGSHV